MAEKELPTGLFQISKHTWFIKAGSKQYIFSGTLTDWKYFKAGIEHLNPGSKTTYRKIN
jgi:hypothetical protein